MVPRLSLLGPGLLLNPSVGGWVNDNEYWGRRGSRKSLVAVEENLIGAIIGDLVGTHELSWWHHWLSVRLITHHYHWCCRNCYFSSYSTDGASFS